MKNILVVEDELNVASFIKKGLKEEGYNVILAHDGHDALATIIKTQIDLIIMDIILPGINGLEICKKIRNNGLKDIPILMLTALGTTNNIVEGLDNGADDYLIKPFKFSELLARIRALLRRKNLTEQPASHKLNIADLELDLDTKTATRKSIEIKLTSTEFKLLEYFMKNQKRVLSRTSILENVWDINFDMGTNVVDVYVNYLRNKIDKNAKVKLIHTVVGMGYIMKEK